MMAASNAPVLLRAGASIADENSVGNGFSNSSHPNCPKGEVAFASAPSASSVAVLGTCRVGRAPGRRHDSSQSLAGNAIYAVAKSCRPKQLRERDHRTTTDISPCSLRVGVTVIRTSCPSVVRNLIKRPTEKLPARLRINAETWGCLMPRISPACGLRQPALLDDLIDL